MSKSRAYQAWIDAGYDLFAHEGHDGIQIERIARIVDLNKSGFYHYFGDRTTYFQHLMHQHILNADFLVETVKSIRNFMPEYIQFLATFSTPVLAHMQLVRESHIPLFANTYKEVNNKVDQAILPLWADFINIPDNPALALRYFEFFRDMLYARMNRNNFSYEFIHSISMEAKDLVDAFKNSSSSVIAVTQSA